MSLVRTYISNLLLTVSLSRHVNVTEVGQGDRETNTSITDRLEANKNGEMSGWNGRSLTARPF